MWNRFSFVSDLVREGHKFHRSVTVKWSKTITILDYLWTLNWEFFFFWWFFKLQNCLEIPCVWFIRLGSRSCCCMLKFSFVPFCFKGPVHHESVPFISSTSWQNLWLQDSLHISVASFPFTSQRPKIYVLCGKFYYMSR